MPAGSIRTRIAALSGPEPGIGDRAGSARVGRRRGAGPRARERVAERLGRREFRLYVNRDILGVELCGALKNVLAIAAGAADGLGFGDNGKAGLMTRGLAEMIRLGRRRVRTASRSPDWPGSAT